MHFFSAYYYLLFVVVFDDVLEARNARACCLVRNKIAIDLLQSETNYINALRICRQYLAGTGSGCSGSACGDSENSSENGEIPTGDTNDIYSAFTFLYLNHKRFRDGLQDKVSNWTETSTIGDLFLENGELFSGYIQYVKSCSELLTRINTVVSLRQPLRYSKVIRLGSIATAAGLDAVMEHYAVLPTQRLPQYLFVLLDMLKYTTKIQNDYALLTRAVEDTRRVLEEAFVQIDQAPAPHISEILSVVTTISGKEAESLVVPNRWLVRKGPLAEAVLAYTTPNGKLHTSVVRKPYCFLFNDIIVCCERLKKKKKHKKERKFYPQYAFVAQLELCDVHSVFVNKVLEICLEVTGRYGSGGNSSGSSSGGSGSVVSWTIATDDEVERFEWESDLSANISAANATFHRGRRRARTFGHDQASCSQSPPLPQSPQSSPSPPFAASLGATTSSQKKQCNTVDASKSKSKSKSNRKSKKDCVKEHTFESSSLPSSPQSRRSSKHSTELRSNAVPLKSSSLLSGLTPSAPSSSSTGNATSSTRKKNSLTNSAPRQKTPIITLTSTELSNPQKCCAATNMSQLPPPPQPPLSPQ